MRLSPKLITTVIIVLAALFANAQEKQKEYNPFESIGKKGKVITAYGDRFVEVFDTDSVQRIGSVLYHIYEKRIVVLLDADSLFNEVSDNSSASRWWSVDPLAEKYHEWSPYNFSLNNPLRFVDKEGAAPTDIVYFNQQGQEIRRIESNTIFKTYVQVQERALNANFKNGSVSGAVTYTFEAPMPGVAAGYEASKFQKNDYQIAASTFLLNREISKEASPLISTGGDLPTSTKNHTVGTDLPGTLDVNIVKAMIIQESQGGTYTGGAGTGTTDIMQVNNRGDWVDQKAQVGLTKGQAMTPETSVNAGVKWLFLKGMGSNSKGVMNWRSGKNGDWFDAVSRYNGNPKIDYVGDVKKIYESMTPATPNNY